MAFDCGLREYPPRLLNPPLVKLDQLGPVNVIDVGSIEEWDMVLAQEELVVFKRALPPRSRQRLLHALDGQLCNVTK